VADTRTEAEDLAAVAAMRSGDEAGLLRLHSRHGRALLAYATALVGDPGRAEEVVQDVLVAAWRAAARFEARGTVRSWLFGIARRRAISAFHADLGRSDVGDDVLGGVAAGEESEPERIVVARAEMDEVVAAIGRLPPHHREVLLLSCVEQMSGPEIGALLGVPVGTVKSRLSLARKSLARLLEARGAISDEC
jgi:RNA polymerase sigma-70 factor (ECF subfamily)